MPEQVDVVVVGLGPGGEDLAGRLATEGLDVVAIDGGLVGGECPYWGCIPSKTMVRAADVLADGRRAEALAGPTTVRPDWSRVAARVREVTSDWDDGEAVARLEGKGARFVRGWATVVGERTVAVEDRRFEARRALVLATGAAPWEPPIPGLADVPHWTNRQAVAVAELPGSLTVLGGGAIGLELGQVFARFGVDVAVVEVADRLLAMEEPEAASLVARVLGDDGIAVHTGCAVAAAELDDGRPALALADGRRVVADALLVATGRRPDLAALGVGAVGIDEHGRRVPVDGQLRAGPGLWAIGDVTGIGAFTHVSMYQAAIAAGDILGRPGPDADYRALPRVTFTDPEIGAVGLTESAARNRGLDVRTGITDLAASARGWIYGAGNDGFVKLVEDAERRVLVGATSAGPCGGEVLGFLALAVHAAVPTDSLRHMIYAYPTFHRAIEAALDDLAD
jgi:pyruvate/2-oxoglutarate dehydrogenase complex dihydrolipoamide dehydrogenase (E3) component